MYMPWMGLALQSLTVGERWRVIEGATYSIISDNGDLALPTKQQIGQDSFIEGEAEGAEGLRTEAYPGVFQLSLIMGYFPNGRPFLEYNI